MFPFSQFHFLFLLYILFQERSFDEKNAGLIIYAEQKFGYLFLFRILNLIRDEKKKENRSQDEREKKFEKWNDRFFVDPLFWAVEQMFIVSERSWNFQWVDLIRPFSMEIFLFFFLQYLHELYVNERRHLIANCG